MKKLQVGDIVVVSNMLTGIRHYPVLSIDGNKARTKFRVFHVRIYDGNQVYEYGKRITSTDNSYWLLTE